MNIQVFKTARKIRVKSSVSVSVIDACGSALRVDRLVPFGTVVAVSCLICNRRKQQPGSMNEVFTRSELLKAVLTCSASRHSKKSSCTQ